MSRRVEAVRLEEDPRVQRFENGLVRGTGDTRIGDFFNKTRHLGEYIYELDRGKVDVGESGLGEIQEYVEAIKQARIPQELIEDLGLDEMRLGFMRKLDGRELLFVGFKEEIPDDWLISKALATILITRYINRGKKCVDLESIKIAGISQKWGRILATDYYKDEDCVDFGVSLSGGELKRTGTSHHALAIPLNYQYPYHNPGLVTKAMCYVAGSSCDNDEKHSGMFRFSTCIYPRKLEAVRFEGEDFTGVSVEHSDSHHIIRRPADLVGEDMSRRWKSFLNKAEELSVLDGISVPIRLDAMG